MDSDLATSQHMEDVHHCSCTLSQLEIDAVEVLLEFTPASQPQEHAVLQWSGKRKRSYRFGDSDHKEREKFRIKKISELDEDEHSLPHKHTLINAAGGTLSKDLHPRATSPNSPLPSLQMQRGTVGLGALSAPQKILCRQLLKLAVRLGWEIKGMRRTKSFLVEELQSLKNQTSHLKQQHSSTENIQTTNASKPWVPNSPSLAQDRCTYMPQNHRVIKEGDERGRGAKIFTSASTEHNSNASTPTTSPISIELNGHNPEECNIIKAPDCVLWTSPQKDMKFPKAQVDAIVKKGPSPTSKNAQRGAHADLSFCNEHGFIDAHGTWVIVPDTAENYGDGMHAQLTCSTREDSNRQANDVQAQTRGDICIGVTCSTCKQEVTPRRAQTTSCAEDIPARLTASHRHMNQCVDSIPVPRQTAYSNHCADIDVCSHSKSPPAQSWRSSSIDSRPAQRAHRLQSAYHCVDNASVRFLQCLPLQISSNAALAHQFASSISIYEGLPQAIVLLCDRKVAFAEARRRRKEITQIKRHHLQASKLH